MDAKDIVNKYKVVSQTAIKYSHCIYHYRLVKLKRRILPDVERK